MKKRILPQDLSDYLVQNGHANRKEADTFVRGFFEVVEQGLFEDKYVKIKGLGTFKLVSVSERESVNINTGERFQISGHTKVSFTPDTAMKDLINRPFAHFETVDLNEETDTSEFDAIDLETERLMAGEDFPENEEDETAEEVADETDLPEAVAAGTEPEAVTEEAAAAEAAADEKDLAETDLPDAAGTDGPAEDPATAVTPVNTVTPEPQQEVPATSTAPTSAPAATPEPTPATPAEVTTEASAEVTTEAAPDQADAPELSALEADEVHATTPPALAFHEEEISVSAPQPITPVEPKGTATDSLSPSNYTYRETPRKSKRKIWLKRVGMTLLVLFGMGLSYFAGYYRVLCPCSIPGLETYFEEEMADEPAAVTTPATPAAPADKPATPVAQPSAQPVATEPDSLAQQPAPKSQPQSPKAEKAAQEPAAAKKAETPKPAAEKTAPARPATHTVRKGDNLYKISRKYYGSDKYVPAIIKLNHLKDANTISHGMKLKLP